MPNFETGLPYFVPSIKDELLQDAPQPHDSLAAETDAVATIHEVDLSSAHNGCDVGPALGHFSCLWAEFRSQRPVSPEVKANLSHAYREVIAVAGPEIGQRFIEEVTR